MSEKADRCQSILLSLLFYRLTLGVYQQVSWKSFRKTKVVKKRYGIFPASGLGWPCRATSNVSSKSLQKNAIFIEDLAIMSHKMVADWSLQTNKLYSWSEFTKNARVKLFQKVVSYVTVREKKQLYHQLDTARIMCLWHPTATLITMHLSKAKVKLLKKNWTSWRYGISRDGIPQTPGGNGTVRNFFCAVRYDTVERMICGVAVRYAFLPVPSVSGTEVSFSPFDRNTLVNRKWVEFPALCLRMNPFFI